MAEIFISYSQHDRVRVKSLVEALTAEGYEVWWDLAIRAGESFDQLIEDTLKRVKCVVAVWSRQSVQSEWVRAESAWAKDRNMLVSIRIDKDAELPLKFYNVHTRRMVDWQGGREEQAFRDLVADIRKIAGPRALSPAQVPSTELPTALPEVPEEPESDVREKHKDGERAAQQAEEAAPVRENETARFRMARSVTLAGVAVIVAIISVTIYLKQQPVPDADLVVDSGKDLIELSQSQLRSVQQALNDIGFDAGPMDGVPRDKTREAISLFQESRGYRPTGKLTEREQVRLLFDARQAAESRLGAEPQSGTVFRDTLKHGGEGPEMIVIAAGSFRMGCVSGKECSKYELPVRTVNFDNSFAMGKYEVTFEEYDRFARATGRKKPEDQGWGRARRPVINVSWEDEKAYAGWMREQTGKRYRLPSEAEWEYTARAGTDSRWSFGDGAAALIEYAWFKDNSDGQTHPVSEKKPNPWGLYDVHGNVWEWVEDCYHEDYQGAPDDGSAWLEANDSYCGLHVIRGGSWGFTPWYLRSANRSGNFPDGRTKERGFRLAQDL